MGGKSWPCTGTPPTPLWVWPGLGRFMIGKALPAPLEPGFGIGRGSLLDLESWATCIRWPPQGLLNTSGEVIESWLSIGRLGRAFDLSIFLGFEPGIESDSETRILFRNKTMRPNAIRGRSDSREQKTNLAERVVQSLEQQFGWRSGTFPYRVAWEYLSRRCQHVARQ